ncbi:unnamed protein product, partial [Effrenium voratum]
SSRWVYGGDRVLAAGADGASAGVPPRRQLCGQGGGPARGHGLRELLRGAVPAASRAGVGGRQPQGSNGPCLVEVRGERASLEGHRVLRGCRRCRGRLLRVPPGALRRACWCEGLGVLRRRDERRGGRGASLAQLECGPLPQAADERIGA